MYGIWFRDDTLEDSGRYDVSGLPEAQFEPGSNEQVLKNRLGIKSPKEMDDAETRTLGKAMVELVGKYNEKHRFNATDIRDIHKRWLGEIYEWAGEYRQVNVSKGDFPFAAAARVPSLMEQLERDALARYTPCNLKDRAAIACALAVTHMELVLIHPFREGNGRAARVLFNTHGTASGVAAAELQFNCRGQETGIFRCGAGGAG